jgi:hypothetical protein
LGFAFGFLAPPADFAAFFAFGEAAFDDAAVAAGAADSTTGVSDILLSKNLLNSRNYYDIRNERFFLTLRLRPKNYLCYNVNNLKATGGHTQFF